jgi:hypothetical protein
MLNNAGRAVQFGKSVDRGYEGGVTAFPFSYSFVNPASDTWDTQPGASTKSRVWPGNLSHIGPVIPTNGNIQIGVQLDPDHMFKLLDIKYTVYAYNYGDESPIPLLPHYQWHEEKGSAVPAGVWPTNAKYFFYDPAVDSPLSQTLNRYIRANVSIVHNGRYLYGQTNQYVQTQETLPVIPLHIDGIQGNEYGFGQIRPQYLLPANGMLRFDLYNNWSSDVIVGASIRGLKVRL